MYEIWWENYCRFIQFIYYKHHSMRPFPDYAEPRCTRADTVAFIMVRTLTKERKNYNTSGLGG